MRPFDFHLRTQVLFGEGSVERLGEEAASRGFSRALLVADEGLISAGHVERARRILHKSGMDAVLFHDFEANPTTAMVEAGRDFAAHLDIDSIVALGGGSSMDCAKGINFLLTNGGRMQDYWGYGKAGKPMLPMIAIPATAGTGSEAQSYALISDAATHVKMACGDPKASFQLAILDPDIAVSAPAAVRAAAGYDALSHAVESFVTTRRNPVSDLYAREAFRLIEANFESGATGPMQLGAHYAGIAIEHSMLGAAHACANPLTARYGTTHGHAIAVLLPHVTAWNEAAAGCCYRELSPCLTQRLTELRAGAGLPATLRDLGVAPGELDSLAEAASVQWTGKFNPRPFDRTGAREIYECAF
jgi:alcohol dehydrogenase